MEFNFTKWQGCGNDFVLVDGLASDSQGIAELSEKICDRHYGIGADGLILVLSSEKADFRMRIYNADGSEAEMCGNGIRCFARFVFEKGYAKDTIFTVETGAGILTPEVLTDAQGKVQKIRVNMGKPVLAAEDIPVSGFGRQQVVNQPISVLGQEYKMTCVSMGNPHCVIFVEDLAALDLEKVGPLFEKHPWFPKKTNTEFVEVKDRSHLRMRVWERGAAITLACGTGSCATLVAGVLNDKTEKSAEIVLDGGHLFIEWPDDGNVYMSGPAEKVFSGKYSC